MAISSSTEQVVTDSVTSCISPALKEQLALWDSDTLGSLQWLIEPEEANKKLCRIGNPDCEACQ